MDRSRASGTETHLRLNTSVTLKVKNRGDQPRISMRVFQKPGQFVRGGMPHAVVDPLQPRLLIHRQSQKSRTVTGHIARWPLSDLRLGLHHRTR